MVKLLARRQRLRSVELKVYTVVHREKKKKWQLQKKKSGRKWQCAESGRKLPSNLVRQRCLPTLTWVGILSHCHASEMSIAEKCDDVSIGAMTRRTVLCVAIIMQLSRSS